MFMKEDIINNYRMVITTYCNDSDNILFDKSKLNEKSSIV